MPVIRSTTSYKTRAGKVRRIRLFEAWRNMLGRTRGVKHAGNGKRAWVGLPVCFADWAEFRTWALANGYGTRTPSGGKRNSLDRIDPDKGYCPENLRWVTVSENTSFMVAKLGRAAAFARGLVDTPF